MCLSQKMSTFSKGLSVSLGFSLVFMVFKGSLVVFHGFWLVSIVFHGDWFPWFFKVVSGSHGFGWFPWSFNVVSWFSMGFG